MRPIIRGVFIRKLADRVYRVRLGISVEGNAVYVSISSGNSNVPPRGLTRLGHSVESFGATQRSFKLPDVGREVTLLCNRGCKLAVRDSPRGKAAMAVMVPSGGV